MSKHTPRPRIDIQFMRDWLKEDAVLLDMPAEEIIYYLCEEIDQTRIQRDALLAACKVLIGMLASKQIDRFPHNYQRAREAIAKAEGES